MSYCTNCGNQLSEKANFCSGCGKVIKERPEEKKEEIKPHKEIVEVTKAKLFWRKTGQGCLGILNITITIGTIILFRYLGSLGNGGVGIVFLLCLVLGWLGWFIGGFIYKKEWLKLATFINWANVITWIIPVLGVFTSMISLRMYFGFPDDFKKRKIFLTLGLISIILSIINGVAGVLIKLYN